jgi:hypothetical protein
VFHISIAKLILLLYDLSPVGDGRAGLDPLALLLLEEVSLAGGNLRPDGVGEHAGPGMRANSTGLATVCPGAPVSHLKGKKA